MCLASGPSLTREDAAYAKAKARTIVINTTYQMLPTADVLYAADLKWWKWHKGAPEFAGLKYTVTAEACIYPGVQCLRRGPQQGLSSHPDTLCLGSNGGYQAINLAAHLGAAKIVLLGYDMQRGPRGETHWHGKHPHENSMNLKGYALNFPWLVEPLKKAGIAIVNCSRTTALTCFPRMALEDALSGQAVAA